ncbi:hypothetical protein PINS_up013017 [Pythium insidiosum]|nr:hypothetical protein PINS_up013017 [Pythium insidiosum]
MYLADSSRKTALAFILNPCDADKSVCSSPALGAAVAPGVAATPTLSPTRKTVSLSTVSSPSSSIRSDDASMTSEEDEDDDNEAAAFSIHGRSLLSETTLLEKQVERMLALDNHHNGKMRARKSAICSHADCPRAAVSRGRCVRHGGGSRCTFPNCTHGARLYNRCFHHGGCKLCKVDGCTSKAKRYGYCWSHGGGHICDAPGCGKVAAPGGFCWAHGGGNRCRQEGCNRRSYQKHNYFCKQHTSVGAAASDSA